MNLKDICVDLEIAKELKEKGFKQDSFFWWTNDLDSETGKFINELINIEAFQYDKSKDISSPTAEEILKELPIVIKTNGICNDWMCIDCEIICYRINIIPFEIECLVNYRERYNETKVYELKKTMGTFTNKKLCNALAKMWIYLKDNNLLKDGNEINK